MLQFSVKGQLVFCVVVIQTDLSLFAFETHDGHLSGLAGSLVRVAVLHGRSA